MHIRVDAIGLLDQVGPPILFFFKKTNSILPNNIFVKGLITKDTKQNLLLFLLTIDQG